MCKNVWEKDAKGGTISGFLCRVAVPIVMPGYEL
jgi:hypothetical protein